MKDRNLTTQAGIASGVVKFGEVRLASPILTSEFFFSPWEEDILTKREGRKNLEKLEVCEENEE